MVSRWVGYSGIRTEGWQEKKYFRFQCTRTAGTLMNDSSRTGSLLQHVMGACVERSLFSYSTTTAEQISHSMQSGEVEPIDRFLSTPLEDNKTNTYR